jgi:hypothetical protein
MRSTVIVIALSTAACAVQPTGPSEIKKAPAIVEMAYAINVPVLADLQVYRSQFPGGVRLSPIAAQSRWDYTRAYGGSPNVYYGNTAPKCQNYFWTSIVIAPYGAASKDAFTSVDWPNAGLDQGVTYAWSGYFTYSRAALPSEFTINPACTP